VRCEGCNRVLREKDVHSEYTDEDGRHCSCRRCDQKHKWLVSDTMAESMLEPEEYAQYLASTKHIPR